MPWKNSASSMFSKGKFPANHAVVKPSNSASIANNGSCEVCSCIPTLTIQDKLMLKILNSTDGNKARHESTFVVDHKIHLRQSAYSTSDNQHAGRNRSIPALFYQFSISIDRQ
jgi:hypothetical protein